MKNSIVKMQQTNSKKRKVLTKQEKKQIKALRNTRQRGRGWDNDESLAFS